MKKSISVILAWTLAGIGTLAFFLPWVRPVSDPDSQHNVNKVILQLQDGEDSVFVSWIGMRKDEWNGFLRTPTFGLSGFQLLMLESEKSVVADRSKAWLEAAFGSRRSIDRAVNVIPFVLLLLTAAAMSPRKPLRKIYGWGGILLLAVYLWARWRLDSIYADRVLSGMELACGTWITLYAMIAMAILAGIRFLDPKGKW